MRPTTLLPVLSSLLLAATAALVPGLAPAAAGSAVQQPVRINVGGPAGTFEGVAYQADTYGSGGWWSKSTDPLVGTTSSALYQTVRIAPTRYSVPVANGTYDVSLKTAETYFTQDGRRRFSAAAEGQLFVRDLDLHATVGHDRAHTITTRATVSDGVLDLTFSATKNHAVVAGIVIEPVDSVPPVTSLSGGPAQGTVVTGSTASFSLGANEPSRFECSLDGGGWVSCPASYTTPVLPLGVHVLQVRAVDLAGNVDPAPRSRTWTTVHPQVGVVRPGPENTGVPAGVTLTRHDGNLIITTPGTVIDSLDVHGFVVVRASDVTIRRSVIRGGQTTSGRGLLENTTATALNLVVEDSEIVPAFPTPLLDGFKGGNVTLRRVEMRGTVDNVGLHLPNVRVESSWLHSTSYYASSPAHNGGETHNDNIQVHGGRNIRVVGSRLEGANNAAMMVTQDYSPTTDLVVDRNWLDGGGCTMNLHHKKQLSMTGITITDNRFGRNTRLSDCAIIATYATELTTSNNTWLDTGTAVRIRRG